MATCCAQCSGRFPWEHLRETSVDPPLKITSHEPPSPALNMSSTCCCVVGQLDSDSIQKVGRLSSGLAGATQTSSELHSNTAWVGYFTSKRSPRWFSPGVHVRVHSVLHAPSIRWQLYLPFITSPGGALQSRGHCLISSDTQIGGWESGPQLGQFCGSQVNSYSQVLETYPSSHSKW